MISTLFMFINHKQTKHKPGLSRGVAGKNLRRVCGSRRSWFITLHGVIFKYLQGLCGRIFLSPSQHECKPACVEWTPRLCKNMTLTTKQSSDEFFSPPSQPSTFVFGEAHKHFSRKKLQKAPRGQSHIFPIRAPFLTAHCSPTSHWDRDDSAALV